MARTFPNLYDVMMDVAERLDQPLDETGQLGFGIQSSEFPIHANNEHRYILERVQTKDREWGIAVTTATVTAGNRSVAMPTDCRAVREVWEQNSSGEEVIETQAGRWGEMGTRYNTWRYRPTDNDLYFLRDPPAGKTLTVVYYKWFPDLVHGLVRTDAVVGADQVQLPAHVTSDPTRLINRAITVYAGTGANQIRTIDASVDASQRIVSLDTAWTTVPDGTSCLTSTPDIPLDSYDAYVLGICSRMLQKLDGNQADKYAHEREKHLHHLGTALMMTDRTTPIQTRDESEGFHSDPHWVWHE